MAEAMDENRSQRLYEILKDGREHNTCELSTLLETGAFRAAEELREDLAGTSVILKTVRREKHNHHHHAVYRLERPMEQLTIIQVASVLLKTDPAVTLTIDEIHPSLNNWSRWHWALVRQESDRWRWLVRGAAGKTKPFVRPVIVTISYFFPRKNRHDFDNYTPKFILDGLKDVLISDDSSEVIEELRIRFRYDKKHPRTEIILHPT